MARCIECDGVLWSDHSKRLGVHAECLPDAQDAQPWPDLETQLENVIQELDRPAVTV